MKIAFRYLQPFALLVGLAACSSPPAETTHTTSPESATPPTVPAKVGVLPEDERQCYVGTLKADTITLQIERHGTDGITGRLKIIPAEKDRSEGEITGSMHGDTLLADYAFAAEGTQSHRQVAFVLRGDSALEGYGPAEEREGRMVFMDVRKLQFGTGYKAYKMPCKE